MKELLRRLIYKYTSIIIDDDNKNILDYPLQLEYLLYVIIDLEDIYLYPIIQILEEIDSEEFTIEELSKRIAIIKP